jgi:DNA-binding MarR family transcriptional regulator
MATERKSREGQGRGEGRNEALAAFLKSPEGEACIAFSLRGAARKITAFYDARLAPSGLTIAQFSVLAHAVGRPAPSVATLAERLSLDPSTLSRTLKPLEDQGLLDIVPDPDNRRMRRVRLSEAGKAKLREAGQLWMAAQKEAAQVVPLSALAQIREGLDALG